MRIFAGWVTSLPWTDDLDIQPWPRYYKPAHEKWSFSAWLSKVRAQTGDTHTHRQMQLNTVPHRIRRWYQHTDALSIISTKTKIRSKHLQEGSVLIAGQFGRRREPTISLWVYRGICCRCRPRSDDNKASRISPSVLCTDSRSEIPKPVCMKDHHIPENMTTSICPVSIHPSSSSLLLHAW